MNVWPQGLQSPALPGNAAMGVNRDTLIKQWDDMCKQLAAAKQAELNLRMLVVSTVFPNLPEGTNTVELGNGWKIKATGVNNYNLDKDVTKVESALDAIEATGPEGKFLGERLVSWAPKLSVAEYRTLPPIVKAIIDAVLTIKPGTPQLELCEPKVKG